MIWDKDRLIKKDKTEVKATISIDLRTTMAGIKIADQINMAGAITTDAQTTTTASGSEDLKADIKTADQIIMAAGSEDPKADIKIADRITTVADLEDHMETDLLRSRRKAC